AWPGSAASSAADETAASPATVMRTPPLASSPSDDGALITITCPAHTALASLVPTASFMARFSSYWPTSRDHSRDFHVDQGVHRMTQGADDFIGMLAMFRRTPH